MEKFLYKDIGTNYYETPLITHGRDTPPRVGRMGVVSQLTYFKLAVKYQKSGLVIFLLLVLNRKR